MARVMPTWHERAILWVAPMAPPSGGKSPAQELAYRPVREHDASLAASHAEGLELEAQAVLTADQTMEALVRTPHAAKGSVAVDGDELSLVLRGLGEYKRAGGDQGRFLSLWTGAPLVFNRVGSQGKDTNGIQIYIPQPTLVVCGGLQSHLHELLGGDEDGMRPRWLPHLAGGTLTGGNLGARQPDGWRQLLQGLLSSRGTERTWTFTSSALDAFRRHQRAWRRQARGIETPSVGAALKKADTHLARIALVFAEAENPGEGGAIGSDLIDRAAEAVEFVLNCWRALPEQGGSRSLAGTPFSTQGSPSSSHG